jgi:cytochrome c oxidase subunit 2
MWAEHWKASAKKAAHCRPSGHIVRKRTRFFVPAFRTKQDVLPGRYTTIWFQPTKPGKYHLFCAEFCGHRHSGMIGWVYVMEPQDYQSWLSGGASEGSLAENGQKLFTQLACGNCHKADNTGRCPSLVGLFGNTVELTGGATVKANEAYIRESILQPQAKIVKGYEPVMPDSGSVTEDQVLQLVDTSNPWARANGRSARESLRHYDYDSGTRTRALLKCQLRYQVVAPY